MFKKVRYKIVPVLLSLLSLFVLGWGIVLAAGLQIEPGQILLQNVPPSTSYDIFEKTGIKLKVINQDTVAHTYAITSAKPSKVSTGTWLGGYLEIPDPSWFYLEKNELTIGPNDTGYVKMYLKIPNEEKYYNQHWAVTIPIEGKRGKGQVQIMLALYPEFLIETENKESVGERPDGLIGLEPSIVPLENVQLGKTAKAKVTIYNNDKVAHTYRLNAIIPELISETKKQAISPSPGYSWIPDAKWIKLKPGNILGIFSPVKTVTVKPGKNASFPIEVVVPRNDNYYGQKWEVIIMAEPEKGEALAGQAGFVRLRIETQSK